MKHALYPGELDKSQCRIGAARLRGVASFGFLIPTSITEVDIDLTEVFKVVRYEPPIKVMQGDQIPEVSKFHRYTEIENVQRFSHLIPEGTPVVYTEKIHGANCRIGVIDGEIVAGSHRCQSSSSGMGIYWTPWPVCHDLLSDMQEDGTDIIIFGEVFGPGVQDLTYAQEKVEFRCFDISINGNYLPYLLVRELCDSYHIPRVPALAMGKYSREMLDSLTDGQSMLADHIREGVVVKALEESEPRQILKSVSVDYLAR
jgi:RNA ligase (TIGR02306 family)